MPKARAPVRGRAVSQPDGAARARRQSTRRQSGASVPAGPRRRAAAPPRGRQPSEPAATQRPAVAGQAVVLDAAQLRAVVADVVRDALLTVGPTAACGSTGLAGCRDAAGPSAQQDTPPTTTRSPSPPPALPPPMAPPPPPLPPPSATPPTGSPPHLPGVPGSAAVGRRGADIMGLGRLRYAADVTALEAAALAPATARAYRGTWDRVRHFIGIGPAIPLFPIATATVVDFIGACFRAGSGASALASHCSAIAYGHRIRGLADPTADFRVRKLLAGARRLRPSRDTRTAVTLDELGRLCAAVSRLPLPAVDRAAFRAICSLAFFGMLRPGEVVLGANPAHTVRVHHVSVHRDGLSLTIPSSKTSPVPFTTELVARPDLACCPVRAVQEFLSVRPVGRHSDFLFLSGSGRPITTRQLTQVVRQAGRLAGLDVRRLAGHCFRIGGASYGAQLGMTELQLKEAGRWASSAVRRYLRLPVSLSQLAAPPARQHPH
ncbi:uncharacterized protein LOC122389606 isoform X4 [Amphibalanus amphitrite]|nr:uncharacterized protein LOC122388832 isoform X4 [Amphibalanus amphitrite]XP_043237718.1 uncharacterized protein LOC122389606 isoform X4 [Amphibalanus amphitrite]